MVYDIYLLWLRLNPVAVVGRLVLKQEGDSYIQKEKLYTKQQRHNTKTQNTENRKQKYKTKSNIRRTLKNIKI